ncbi:MAG: protein-disulfide reductase DsbD family protein [Janthinobacterium lividum]
MVNPRSSSAIWAVFLAMLVLALSPARLTAQLVEAGNGGPGPVKAEHLTAELTALRPQLTAGGTLQAGLVLTLEEHWHVYWSNAGDSGEPPKITWTLPQGVTADPMQFPPPARLPLGPLMDYGYETQVAFPVLLHAAPGLKPGKLHLDAHIRYLVCAAQCLPGKAHLGLDVDVVPGPLSDPPLVGALGAAINSLPKPLPADTQIAATGDAKAIAVTLHTGEKATDAQFYPFDTDQIDNAAAQGVEPMADGVRMVLARPAGSTSLPATLHGLVELSGGQSFDITVPVKPGTVTPIATTKSGHAPASADSGVTLLGEIALAFGGGLLLNLMPCVFPVLFLKGLALVHSSGEEKRRQRLHGLTYTLGILVSFWAVVAVLLLLRAGGRQVGWGFQMQSPGFVAVLAALVFFLGLSLAGQFEIGLSLTSAGGGLAQKQGFAGSFFTGVLATVVATPCMGPLLGAAVGFALSQPIALTFLIFTALALGLALPYLVLTLQPQWTAILPKPGAWMETLKQFTAVPLFATAIWLAWVYGQLYGAEGLNRMALLLLSFLVLAIAGWALGRWPARWGSSIAAVALIAFALVWPLRSQTVEAETWQSWSPENLASARSSGQPVFIDFTAAWCLSCKVNEAAVLRSDEIESKLAKGHFKLLKADWTQYDPKITAELASVNRSGVPTYIIFPAGKTSNADVLPELLTRDLVSKAIDKDLLLGTASNSK